MVQKRLQTGWGGGLAKEGETDGGAHPHANAPRFEDVLVRVHGVDGRKLLNSSILFQLDRLLESSRL